MTLIAILLGLILLVIASVSAYLIGVSRGQKGQKKVEKHIYIQETKPQKKRGFATEEKTETNISKKKRYTLN